MGKLGGLVLAIGIVLVGARFKSKIDLTGRVAAYQEALQNRALATPPDLRPAPSQAEIESGARALAQEFQLEVSDIRIVVQSGVDPVGAGAALAGPLGGIEGPSEVDAEGNVVPGKKRVLKTTLATVQVHVRGEGFMCTVERDVSARRNFGYALQ
jgi:hypothetical protein